MTVVLSKEAELKEQVNSLKASVSGLDNKANQLSKQVSSLQDEVKDADVNKVALAEALKSISNKNAQIQALDAENSSLAAQAAKADSVLVAIKGLKSLLASV